MNNYVIITENDESNWNDVTGLQYHFPSKYKNLLLEGSNVIYYKGKLKNKEFRDKRLSDNAHYFGIGKIFNITKDGLTKNYFAKIGNFRSFEFAIPIKLNGDYIENVTKKNHWRDGVRYIDQVVYEKIIELSSVQDNQFHLPEEDYNESHTNYVIDQNNKEGKKTVIYTTKYERKKSNRDEAIKIHGFNCVVCNINFKDTYGEIGEGFIHIHHLNPLYNLDDEVKINPKEDLVPVCPNCHSIIHRNRNKVLTIEEMKSIYKGK